MKKITTCALTVVLLCSLLPAQEKVDLFGYFESQFMGADIQGEFIQLYSNKLRIDLKFTPSDKITFAANFDYITYHGKTLWNILDYLPATASEGIPEEMRAFYVLPFNDRKFLDNAFIKLALNFCDLTFGKQQISLGTGYAWNPTDVFNTKDLLDPTYEQPGHNAFRADVPIGGSATLTALYAPGEDWKDSARMVQLKSRISHFDLTLIAVEKHWRFHDYTKFDAAAMDFLVFPERRRLIGAATAGEILGVGVWAEAAFNDMESTKDFYELAVGMDYTFDFQTYVMAEYYRNTLAKTDYRDYDLNDWMRMMSFEQKALCRDQVYVLAQHPAGDFIQIGISSIVSITDGSLVLVPMFTYSFSDNVEMLAYLNFNLGEEGKANSKNMGNGGLFRIRIYF